METRQVPIQSDTDGSPRGLHQAVDAPRVGRRLTGEQVLGYSLVLV
jgi:hypothetical protein